MDVELVGNSLIYISRTFDQNYIESIYRQLPLDYNRPYKFHRGSLLGHIRPAKITVNANNELNGEYRSSANLYHTIKAYLLGRPDLIQKVRDSTRPFADSKIRRTKQNGLMFDV